MSLILSSCAAKDFAKSSCFLIKASTASRESPRSSFDRVFYGIWKDWFGIAKYRFNLFTFFHSLTICWIYNYVQQNTSKNYFVHTNYHSQLWTQTLHSLLEQFSITNCCTLAKLRSWAGVQIVSKFKSVALPHSFTHAWQVRVYYASSRFSKIFHLIILSGFKACAKLHVLWLTRQYIWVHSISVIRKTTRKNFARSFSRQLCNEEQHKP